MSPKKLGKSICTSKFGFTVIVSLISLGIVVSCSEQEASAAPLRDNTVLERLAVAYEEASQSFPVSPATQTPLQKKSFVIKVFARVGYSYRATLFAMAQTDVKDEVNQGLIDLLLFPTVGVGPEDVNSIYSADELEAVRTLQLR